MLTIALILVELLTLGERGYAAQETMHHLMSLKLHSLSFKVIPVSLNGSRTGCPKKKYSGFTHDNFYTSEATNLK